VTLHDLNLAATYCHRLYLLSAGQIVTAGAPEEVLTPGWIRAVYGVTTTCIPHPTTGRLLLAFAANT
jgi:iron complex transport system ATP-binding protein